MRIQRHGSGSIPLRHACPQPPHFGFPSESRRGRAAQKWIYLIALLIAGPFLAIMLFVVPPPPDVTNFVAHRYVKAAIAGDAREIRSLCADDSTANAATAIAETIRANPPRLHRFSFQKMRRLTPDAVTGLQMIVRSGLTLRMEFERKGGKWVIVSISLS